MIRTRIAPSPTGKMHIGTLSTALFDYFLARRHGGQFLIRIEDTDRERLVPGALENLLLMLEKFHIDYDEGPFLKPDGTIGEKGNHGPYIQSARLEIYQKYAQQLLNKGCAYVCFCSAERLEEMRKSQIAVKQTSKYDRHCLNLTAAEVQSRLAAGEDHVIRMKVPEGKTVFFDAIRGEIVFDHREVDDCIIMKSDGFPTYYLACVVDDHLMEITHVLRGEEWISSTPKSLILYEMFGWEKPVFAHVPLLLGPDKKKLSKRTGDTAVEEYLKHGYLPEAVVNFVGTLGFNPSADREIFSVQELVAQFDLAKVNKSGAVLNIEKLDWMNKHYLMALPEEDLLARVAPFLSAQQNINHIKVQRAILVERSRVSRLTDFTHAIAAYLTLEHYDSALLVWKKSDQQDTVRQLKNLAEHFEKMDDRIFEQILLLERNIKEYITLHGLANGNVLWPLRVALSGLEKSATPFECLWVLGKAESLQRIYRAINLLS